MTAGTTLYRVTVKTTGSLQPGGSYWRREVIYCGYDQAEALRVYYQSEPTDVGGSYGNAASETVLEQLDTSDVDLDNLPDMEEAP